jgi:hypothetical protein
MGSSKKQAPRGFDPAVIAQEAALDGVLLLDYGHAC